MPAGDHARSIITTRSFCRKKALRILPNPADLNSITHVKLYTNSCPHPDYDSFYSRVRGKSRRVLTMILSRNWQMTCRRPLASRRRGGGAMLEKQVKKPMWRCIGCGNVWRTRRNFYSLFCACEFSFDTRHSLSMLPRDTARATHTHYRAHTLRHCRHSNNYIRPS